MGHGLPDWYRGVNVAYQALSEMIIRPKYGAAHVASFQGNVVASSDNILCTITGKGVIYGIAAWINATGLIDNDNFSSIVDSETIGDWLFSWHRTYGSDPIILTGMTGIDDVNFNYGWLLCQGFTFETSFVGVYTERMGRTPEVRADVVYALI